MLHDFLISKLDTLLITNALLSSFQGHLPFAVVGSSDEVKIGNKMVKARQYPWGTVQGISLWYF